VRLLPEIVLEWLRRASCWRPRSDFKGSLTSGVSHVVALKLDRVFRNAADALVTVRAWTDAGIALHLVDMAGISLDTNSSMGTLFLTMLAAFGEFEG
jgi:DNA invertase Pin-like site-specific DNA recombinase